MPTSTRASRLPARADVARDAWRDYDAAWSLLTRDDAAARRLFEQTYVRFAAAGDATAAGCVAAAAIVLIACRHSDFRGLGEWLRRFAVATVPPDDGLRPLALRFHVATVSLPGLDHAHAYDSPRTAASGAAAYELLRSPLALAADERLVHAKQLLDWLNHNLDRERFETMASLLTPAVVDPSASPFWVGVWWWQLGHMYGVFGEADAARACRERAWQVARGHESLEGLEYSLVAEDLLEHLRANALALAADAVARMRVLAPAVNAVWRAHGLVYEARFRLLQGEPGVAAELCRRALGLYAGTEVAERERSMCRVTLAFALVAVGAHDDALAELDRCRAHQSGGQAAMLEVQTLAVRCCRALAEGRADLDALLRAALARAQAAHAYALLLYLPQQASLLFDAAWSRGIEPAFVARAVQQRRLPPPDPVQEAWPWQLRVRCIGALALERSDAPIAVGRKAQKKPEELLLAVLAAGGEADVETLVDDVWSDGATRDPRGSFDMALSRLRKLVGVDGALVVADGRLRVDRRIVWCDLFAFETLRLRLHDALATEQPAEVVVELARRVAALCRGPLFGGAFAAPWAAAPRERFAMAWQRAVQDAGDWLERHARWHDARVLYENGLEQHMLAEPLYRGLMRCHLALGERAEAVLLYRRCREVLSRALGLSPGEEMQRLHEQALVCARG